MDSPLPPGTLTFLFTDIEGSTAAWDRHGDAMAIAQQRHDAILHDGIRAFGGHVFSTAGDGVGAAFDDAAGALDCAASVQRALAAEPWPAGLVLRVRMGAHTGVAIARDGDYFGTEVIRAARIMSLVGGARVALSARTAALASDLLPDGYVALPIGTARLKGLTEPEQVFALAGPGLDEPGVLHGSSARLGRGAPAPVGRLVGRASEMDELGGRLLSQRLVTLVGPGGVGKTRLALEVVGFLDDKFPDGLAWVELASLGDGSAVLQAVADAVGVRSQPGSTTADLLVGALTGRRVLIGLDNAEHVREAVAGLVEMLVTRCPDTIVLATSRQRLGVAGEQVMMVGPLATGSVDAAATELLIERMEDAGAAASMGADESAAILEIATRLDGLPLALELAGARCRSLGAVAVADRLRTELGGLTDGSRVEGRHRTLEAALAWSYDLLEVDAQELLRAVSVFAGGFTLEAAHAVAPIDSGRVDDAVASLVEQSLLHRRGRRFHLLETTRSFAQARLRAAREESVATEAHRDHVVARVGRIVEGLVGRDEARWVAELDADWPDVRACVRRGLERGDPAVVDIVVGLAYEAFFRRAEAFSWTQHAFERFGDVTSPAQHDLIAVRAWVAWSSLDVPTALELAERALALAPGPLSSRSMLPESAAIGAFNFAGRPAEAVALCRASIAELELRGDAYGVAFMHGNLALSAALMGDAAALDAGRAAIRFAERAGNPTVLSYAHFGAAVAATLQEDVEGANAHVDLALESADSVRNTWCRMSALSARSWAISGTEPDRALMALLEVVDELQRAGWSTHAWATLRHALPPLWQLGFVDVAAFVAGACDAAVVAPMYSTTPAPLADLPTGGGSPALAVRFRQGAHRPLPEVVRVARRDQELPPLRA